MRGSGKTAMGQLLAKKLKRHFFDLDQEIEKQAGQTINEIVEIHGWPHFRKLEAKICKEFGEKENLVISCGGGVVENDENIKNLKKNGKIIFLKVPISLCAQRIKKSQNRPSLTGKNFLEELNEIWERRKEKYLKAADFIMEDEKDISKEKRVEKIFQTISLL